MVEYKIKTIEGVTFKPFETLKVKLDVPIQVKPDFKGFIFADERALLNGFTCNALPISDGERFAIVTNTKNKMNLLAGGTVIGTVFIF